MQFLKSIRVVSLVAMPIVGAAGAVLWLQSNKAEKLSPTTGIGGPFSLVDHRGKIVTDRDLLGKPMLVFFGFTHCPDVCPTTLFELTTLLEELGPDADRLNVVFITVDPDRDTPEQLALYLSSFDSQITGLSGSEAAIAGAMKGYRAVAQKIPLKDGGYTMDHTATIFMMNKRGQLVGVMNYQESPQTMRAKVRRLLSDAASG